MKFEVTGGVTPKGTVYVREFIKNGQLFHKKVFRSKDHVQYDTLFNLKTKKPNAILITDFKKDEHYLAAPSRKITLLDKFLFLFNRKRFNELKYIGKIISTKEGKFFAPMITKLRCKPSNPALGNYVECLNLGLTGFVNKHTDGFFNGLKRKYV